MKLYEQMFILAPNLDEEGEKALVSKLTDTITSEGGEIVDSKRWGKRRLAYEIKGNQEGIYWVNTFKSPPTTIAELRRLVRISEGYVRDILIDLTYAQKAAKRREEWLKASEARRASRRMAVPKEEPVFTETMAEPPKAEEPKIEMPKADVPKEEEV
jgi:small subunit ribosomal protein S6